MTHQKSISGKAIAICSIALFSVLTLVSCDLSTSKANSSGEAGQTVANSPLDTMATYPFPYHLDQPTEKHKLPTELKEISGLAWMKDEVLATVQDEKGNIYIYDFAADKVTEIIDFGKRGDYEGIAVKGDETWIVRSDGRLYQYREGHKTKIFDTPLDGDFNVEGLEWDEKKKVFLLACKGFPGQGKALKHKKACYAFDPKKGKLNSRPVLVIDLKEVAAGRKLKAQERAEDFLNPGKGNKVFQPSGIAVHPQSGHIYVIASVGKKLIVMSRKGKLLHVASLEYSYFHQPEGICFNPDGIMYLSSEGSGGRAKVMRFDPS